MRLLSQMPYASQTLTPNMGLWTETKALILTIERRREQNKNISVNRRITTGHQRSVRHKKTFLCVCVCVPTLTLNNCIVFSGRKRGRDAREVCMHLRNSIILWVIRQNLRIIKRFWEMRVVLTFFCTRLTLFSFFHPFFPLTNGYNQTSFFLLFKKKGTGLLHM